MVELVAYFLLAAVIGVETPVKKSAFLKLIFKAGMLLGGWCNTIFLTPTFLHLALCHKTKFSKYVFIKMNATMKGKFNSWLFDAIFF